MGENNTIFKKRYKTRQNWKEEDENKLIELWSERIEQLKGLKRKGPVYADIAEHLEKFTDEEIHNKIHNLTNKYNKICHSGGNPYSWKYFLKIRKILHSSKVENSDSLMVEETFTNDKFDRTLPDTTNIKQEIDVEPYQLQEKELHHFLSTSPSPSKSSSNFGRNKRKESLQEKILEELKRSNELTQTANEIAEQSLIQNRENNEIMKQLLINSMELQSKLLEKL